MRHLPKQIKNKIKYKYTIAKETKKIAHVSSAIVSVAVIQENFIEEVALELGPEADKFLSNCKEGNGHLRALSRRGNRDEPDPQGGNAGDMLTRG